MLCLLLTLLSCSALKLSDPVSLRDLTDTDENQSLQAWCVGTGCVMPFTPASCLSWCDWNYDKQADAEARGAFGDTSWKKKQVQATAFNMIFSAVNGGGACDKAKMATERFMDPKVNIGTGGTYGVGHVPIFPDGDEEKGSGDTYLKCKHCYIVQDVQKNDIAPGRAQFSVEFTAGNNGGSKINLYQHDNGDQCGVGATKLYWFELPKFTAGKATDGKWVSAGGACAVKEFGDVAGKVTQTANLAKCTKNTYTSTKGCWYECGEERCC